MFSRRISKMRPHFPGGHTPASSSPRARRTSRKRCGLTLRCSHCAQSSLTGGARPRRDPPQHGPNEPRPRAWCNFVRVEAGVTLTDLDLHIQQHGSYYRRRRPSPARSSAHRGDQRGRRRHIQIRHDARLGSGLTLGLAERRRPRRRTRSNAREPGGHFDVLLGDEHAGSGAAIACRSQKISAGYFAAPHMDLIDLFIGAEGTLGVITEVMLRVRPFRPATCLAFVPFRDRDNALAFVRRLRDAARETCEGKTRAASTSQPSST